MISSLSQLRKTADVYLAPLHSSIPGISDTMDKTFKDLEKRFEEENSVITIGNVRDLVRQVSSMVAKKATRIEAERNKIAQAFLQIQYKEIPDNFRSELKK